MCGVFSPSWAVWGIFLRNYFWLETSKTREGDKAYNMAAARCDLLHFKLELMPKYWKSHLNGHGCWLMRFFSISSLNLIASSLQHFPRKLMLKSGIQLSQYDRCQTQWPKEFKACRPFQIYQSALGIVAGCCGIINNRTFLLRLELKKMESHSLVKPQKYT